MKSIRKTIFLSLPFILLFSLALPISHADDNTAEMSIVPSQQAVYFNETFTVDVVINADNVVTAQCSIKFNATLLTALKVENGDVFTSLSSNGTIDNTNGTIDDIYAWQVPGTSGGVFARITFKAKEMVGNAFINLVSGDTFVPPYNLTLNNATVEVRNYPVYINVEPSQPVVGETTDVNITLDTNGNELSIMTFDIIFNATLFHVNDSDVINGGMFDNVNAVINNTTGNISIFALQAPFPPGVNGTGNIATIKFTPLQTGVSDIAIVNMDVIDVNGNHLYYIIQNATLEADLTPPVVTFEIGNPYYNGSNWITSETPLYINATDAHDYNIYYRIWNGTWQEWQEEAANTDIILHIQDEGLHYIEYYARDAYNNTSPTGNTTLNVDNTPPTTNITLYPSSPDGENGWYISNVTLTLMANDTGCGVDAIYYSVDNGTMTEYTEEIIPGEGEHIISYYAMDNLGNKEEIATKEVKIDKTAPYLKPELEGTEGNNGWYTSTVTITLNASDATSGIQEVRYMIDSGAWQDYAEPFPLGDGIHTINYEVKDNAGNDVSGKFNVSIDTTAPTAAHSLKGTFEDGKYTTDVTITLSANDNLAGVKEIHYRLDGGTWQIFPGAAGTDTVSAEGVHTIEYYAVDNAGNQGTTHQATFTIEKNKKPVADFTYTPTEPLDTDTITFVDHSTDEDGQIVSWFWEFGDGTTSTKQSPTHKYEDNGTYVVKLTVTDDKNATSTKQVAIVVANKAPVAKFTFAPANPKIGDEIEFTSHSLDDDGTIVSYLWNFGDGNTSTEQNPTHSYEKTGTYNVTLKVTDNDGATHTQMQQIKVTKEEVNIWLYLIIIVILVIIAVAVVAIWKKRTKSS